MFCPLHPHATHHGNRLQTPGAEHFIASGQKPGARSILPRMIAYSNALCREICGAGTVALEISTMEDRRKAGLLRFSATLGAAAAVAAILAYALRAPDRIGLGFALALVIVAVATVLGFRQLGKVAEALKVPVLQTIAAKGGLAYSERDFDPPVYADARKALFGNWLSTQTFTDLFSAGDENGKRFALYEAVLVRGSGKSRHIVFSGQVHAWQRQVHSGSEIVIVPDRGIFNFFKPVGGMERVRFEGDPEFESRFEAYAFEPQQAMMVIGSDFRRALLELRQAGRVFAYIGPEEVLVAGWGRNRFEPGSMFRAVPGEERVRDMVEDVCAGLATLERLKAAIV
jgi:hypothetical protein